MHSKLIPFLLILLFLRIATPVASQAPPKRSTSYSGSSTQKVEFASAVYDPNRGMTAEAWVYRQDDTRCETIVSHDFTHSFWLGFCGGKLRFYRSGSSADADTGVPKNRWTHVAASYDATNGTGVVRFYIDGLSAGTRTLANTGAGHNLKLQIASDPGGYQFLGALDEVRIWSLARSQGEIQTNRFIEISSGTGLVAAFPQGGIFDAVAGRNATTAVDATPQVNGVLPRDLVVPVVAVSPVVDGNVLSTEYDGSEEIPFRYRDGTNEVDTVARIVAFPSNTSSNRIFVGITGFKTASGAIPGAHVVTAWGPAPLTRTAPGTNDYRLTGAYNDGSISGERGDGSTFQAYSTPSPAGAMLNFCGGEFVPACIEFGTLPLNRTTGAAFMLQDWRLEKPLNVYSYQTPFDANGYDPSTWARVTFGSTIGSAASVAVNVRVVEHFMTDSSGGTVDGGLAGATVSLFSGAFGPEVAQGVTDASGRVRLNALVTTNVQVKVQVDLPSGWSYEGLSAVPGAGIMPVTTSPSSATFPVCPNTCAYADLVVSAHGLPAGGMNLTGFTPAAAAPRTRLRDTPLKELPPTVVVIQGTNLHAMMNVWLTTCSVGPSSPFGNPWGSTLCSQSQYTPLTVLGVSSDRLSLFVSADTPTNWFNSSGLLLVQDPISHTGWVPWQFAPGSITIGLPPYPLVHGFEFINERDGTQFDEFSEVFSWHAYDCASIIPLPPVETCPGCRVPDPLYLTYYSLVFSPWVELMNGSCLGMSSMSLQFARGDLSASSFGSGVYFANGLPGVASPSDSFLHPPKPQIHHFRTCTYSEPVNLWAYIHRNQATQATGDFLDIILSQMHGTGLAGESIDGDPVDVLGRIRSGLRSYVLAFNQSGNIGEAHVVTPYGIIDGKGIDAGGFGLIDKPNSTVIQVYDSNWPGDANRFFEVDRVANTYKYVFDVLPSGPDLWHGSGTYTVPISFFPQSHSMPGADILARGLSLLVFGSGDVLYTDSSGGQWGWDAAGAQHDTYLGAKSIAPFTATPGVNPTRSVFFFPPTNSPPKSIQLNTRGKDYAFFGGEGGTLCFLTVSNTAPGQADQLTLGSEGDRLGSFRLTPQTARTSVHPAIGMNFTDKASLVFAWEGLSISAGKSVQMLTHRDQLGVELQNDNDQPVQPVLRIIRATAGGVNTNFAGPFNVPVGASIATSMPGWPDSTAVLSQIDLNRDGVPETIILNSSDVPPSTLPPQITVGILIGMIHLTWPIPAENYMLEQTDTLSANAKWGPVSALPAVQSANAVVRLSPAQTQSYFRLRRIN